MNTDKAVFRCGGLMILISVLLSQYHSVHWLWLTAFASLNVLQASFTGFWPLTRVLARIGFRPSAALVFVIAVCGFALLDGLTAPRVQAASIVWSMAGDLSEPRRSHTATLLVNGKVMIHGGYGGGAVLRSTELFDPVTRTWSTVGGAFYERLGHRATLLRNGRVLVTGGSFVARSEEVFDPVTNNWYATARLELRRSQHTASRLHDGRVLVAGGWSPESSDPRGFVTSAEIYDPVTQTWTRTGDMNVGRWGHVASVLPNGKVVLIGGFVAIGDSNSAELFDPATGAWSPVSGMFYDRVGEMHRSTTLQDGRAVVTGGKDSLGVASLPDVEVFAPATLGFYSVGKLNQPRRYHESTLLPNGKVMVAGGYQPTNEQRKISLTSTELFDPVSMVWTEVGHMNVARELHTLTALPDGRVLAVGGYDQMDPQLAHRTSELFNSGFGVRVSPDALSPGTSGAGYAQVFTLTGGTNDPPVWSVSSGRLPPGLNLDAVNGALNGTPRSLGSYTFTIRGTTGELYGETSYNLLVTPRAYPAEREEQG